jgi:Tfp pilus assembly PilM family ATPase
LDGILELISNYTGVPTATANPFLGKNIKARTKLKLQPTLLLKACGLAMRGAG